MFRQRIQVRFAKQGDLRFISHQDLMRLFERALRRTGLPLRLSQGFNPRPHISFPLALAVGMVGKQEVMEFALDRWAPVAQVRDLLVTQLPSGIRLLELVLAHPSHKAQVVEIDYDVSLLPGLELTQATIDSLLEEKELMVTRRRKGRQKQVNIRPSIRALSLNGQRLNMRLVVSEQGTTRPEEVLLHLGIDVSELDTPLWMERSLVKLKASPRLEGDFHRRRARV